MVWASFLTIPYVPAGNQRVAHYKFTLIVGDQQSPPEIIAGLPMSSGVHLFDSPMNEALLEKLIEEASSDLHQSRQKVSKRKVGLPLMSLLSCVRLLYCE